MIQYNINLSDNSNFLYQNIYKIFSAKKNPTFLMSKYSTMFCQIINNLTSFVKIFQPSIVEILQPSFVKQVDLQSCQKIPIFFCQTIWRT